MEFYFRKFPKQQPVIEDKMQMLREKGCIGVFVSKLLPMVRTIISIPAGIDVYKRQGMPELWKP